jgi:hypothetical protein
VAEGAARGPARTSNAARRSDETTSVRARRVNVRKKAPPAVIAFFVLGIGWASPAGADMSAQDLAKLAQNPIGNIVNVKFQNNTNFGVGPLSGTQNILNFEPVYPIGLNHDWNLLTKLQLPLTWQPGSTPGQGTTFGLGDSQLSGFFAPSQPGANGVVWGIGPIVEMPTDTNGLGNKNWGLGPTAVILRIEKGSPWLYGMSVNNIWSLSSDKSGGSYSNMSIQPFVNYNFPGGTYINSVPIITANWKAPGGQQWTVPVGLGIGHIFHLGKLPVNAQIGGYYNVVHPDDGGYWQARLQVQFLFPK